MSDNMDDYTDIKKNLSEVLDNFSKTNSFGDYSGFSHNSSIIYHLKNCLNSVYYIPTEVDIKDFIANFNDNDKIVLNYVNLLDKYMFVPVRTICSYVSETFPELSIEISLEPVVGFRPIKDYIEIKVTAPNEDIFEKALSRFSDFFPNGVNILESKTFDDGSITALFLIIPSTYNKVGFIENDINDYVLLYNSNNNKKDEIGDIIYNIFISEFCPFLVKSLDELYSHLMALGENGLFSIDISPKTEQSPLVYSFRVKINIDKDFEVKKSFFIDCLRKTIPFAEMNIDDVKDNKFNYDVSLYIGVPDKESKLEVVNFFTK